MIISSWNVRGLGSPLKHRYIVNSLRNVSIATLLQTKINLINLTSLMKKKFGTWNYCHNLDCSPTARILVMWRQDRVDLKILNVNPQIIHCRVHCKIISLNCIISFVYGLHSIVRRRPLWNFIDLMGKDIDIPWLVVGDFNSIRTPNDKLNGAEVTAYEISDMNSCCYSANLFDLRSLGSPYTWTNGTVFS